MPGDKKAEVFTTGDAANLLTPTIGDANTMIPESKAFMVNVVKRGEVRCQKKLNYTMLQNAQRAVVASWPVNNGMVSRPDRLNKPALIRIRLLCSLILI